MVRPKAHHVDSEKVRLELRFDADVARSVTALADEAGISLNQLMQGLARWALWHGHPGEPKLGREMKVETIERVREVEGSIERPGCIWFGEVAYDLNGPGRGERVPDERVMFMLDFSERRAVQEFPAVRETEGVGHE